MARLTRGLGVVVAGVFASLLSGSIATATITQVDGTIIPESNRVQTALDAQGESLDAILDASELPQVFLPNTSQPVVFTDIVEGAGFENSFGWYNVGDDVLTPAGRAENLHPIMGCGTPMEEHPWQAGPAHDDHHHGETDHYEQNAEPNDQVMVDFALEETELRYKGGFIGFYLITPENNPSGDNCGDFPDDPNDDFGFIYFTQKDLNDDGDFVHHLVYTSGLDPDRFYFGFEDLFRGGDNDFEDMMMVVDGLTPPCIPSAEICDGFDNDCDMLVDTDDPDLVGELAPCTCDGVSQTCADGVLFGACQTGETVCIAGELQCTSTVGPTAELCDLIDNNCNDIVDDNPIDDGSPCDGADPDLCPEGVEVCIAGALVCDDMTGPNPELCNDFDDDCDMLTDEDPVDEGGSCGTDLGVCESGTEVCIAGGILDCQGEVTGGPEVCNLLDDDCDGVADNNLTDTGADCGTDVGECEFGTTICNSGVLECAGGTGPVPETCNLLNDDCDMQTDEMPIDVGSPCGTDVGVCEPGTIVCTAMGPECQGETTGGMETCNLLDDDCNGVIDDDPVDEGSVCGTGEGVCEPGVEQCINGMLECVGGFSGTTETCNGIDDDCDGTVDEGDLCEGGACGDGVCAAPCGGGEFECPIGERCENGFCEIDPCFGIQCPLGENDELSICVDGVCTEICETVTCPGDLVCRDTDGFCVPDNCNFLPLCLEDEVCVGGLCESDPCFGVSCGVDEFCRDGTCIGSCAGVECATIEQCVDGQCQPTGCMIECASTEVCDADTGECIPDPCRGQNCDIGQVCDPSSGMCINDPCSGIDCPGDQVCELGNCFDPPPDEADAGIDRELVTAGGGGGCASGGSGSTGLFALLLLVAFGAARSRRMRRQLLAACAICAVAGLGLASSACQVNEFCLNCEKAAGGDGGIGTGDGGAGIDAQIDAGPDCSDGVVQQELCDGIDNDCDGQTDEDFDLDDDILNCGMCGNICMKPGAIADCENAECELLGCFPGNVDLNDDLMGPYDDSDGCEYGCFTSNNGDEACDGLDNDCNGAVDEDTDFDNDAMNCGECGRVCNLFQADTSCSMGVCGFDPATDCNPGFIDINGDQMDGCEYSCTSSGPEICDLRDNDCNGAVDETFDHDTDPLNCGQCDKVCSFPNATASCSMATCVFDPMTDCDPNFHDANGLQIDGCEYACIASGPEVCDQIDNDCNGFVDDNPTDAGGMCNNAPMGVATGICTDTGTLTCSAGMLVCLGAPEPADEVCDDMDNDCDTFTDEFVTQACYTGPMGTEDVGVCVAGTEDCVGGVFDGMCDGETTPSMTELCNNFDDDCNGQIDEDGMGGPLVLTCYNGTVGTAGVGTCVEGTATCQFGALGNCIGEVVDTFDVCGDGLDTDCDMLDDAAEGCLVADAGEVRLDEAGGSLGTGAGAEHSFDLHIAAGGSPLGSRIYAVWSDLSNGNADIYFRRSTDGGVTWGDIINLTGSIGDAAVKPQVHVGAGGTDTVHVVYQTVNGGVRDIRSQTSTDSGQTFGAASSALDSSGDSFHHHAATSGDGSILLIVWEQLNTTTLTRDIVSRVSTDSGASFAAERTINVGSGGSPVAGQPRAAVTSTGRYVWVWREVRGGTTPDVFAAFSDSDTAAPASDARLDNDTGDTRISDFPVLVAGDYLYVVWQDISTQPSGGSDVVFTRSTSDAATWDAEQIIDDPALEVSSSFTPSMDVDAASAGGDDDIVAIAWEDRRQGTQAFASVSTDGGATFFGAQRASSDMDEPVNGVTRRPSVALGGNGVVVVAYEHDLGTGIEHVFAASSIDNGSTWTLTHAQMDTGSGQSLLPVVVRATGGTITNGAIVSWVDFRSGSGINGDPWSRRIGQ